MRKIIITFLLLLSMVWHAHSAEKQSEARSMIEQAIDLKNSGSEKRQLEALELYETIVEKFPQTAEARIARNDMALIHESQRDYAAALKLYKQLIQTEDDPDQRSYYQRMLLRCMVHTQSPRAAMKYLETLRQADPDTYSESVLWYAFAALGRLYVEGAREYLPDVDEDEKRKYEELREAVRHLLLDLLLSAEDLQLMTAMRARYLVGQIPLLELQARYAAQMHQGQARHDVLEAVQSTGLRLKAPKEMFHYRLLFEVDVDAAAAVASRTNLAIDGDAVTFLKDNLRADGRLPEGTLKVLQLSTNLRTRPHPAWTKMLETAKTEPDKELLQAIIEYDQAVVAAGKRLEEKMKVYAEETNH